jgi:hypothetical protein
MQLESSDDRREQTAAAARLALHELRQVLHQQELHGTLSATIEDVERWERQVVSHFEIVTALTLVSLSALRHENRLTSR